MGRMAEEGLWSRHRTMKPAPLILVVGMHRSGTSLLGSILDALGVALPGPLIPADKHNPAGYFERSDITALQEELLIDLQRWWPSESGTLPLPQGWLSTARTQRAAACLKRLLQQDQRQQKTPWAIKDPRSSLLLPLWRQVAAELDLPLRLLLAFRDPTEVVTSLVTRDAASTGMTAARAQALWIRHQQQVLRDAGDLPLHVVSYSRWFDAPEPQIKALLQFCHPHLNNPQALGAALQCIRSDYRRSTRQPQKFQLSTPVKRWHQQLEQAASTGSVEPLHALASPQRRLVKRFKRWRSSRAQLKQHPWSRALRALGSSDPGSHKAGLLAWAHHGIPPLSLQQLRNLNQAGFPGADPSANDGEALPNNLNLGLVGGSLEAWSTHLWINQLPLSAEGSISCCEPQATTEAVLHLQALETTAQNPSLLLHLCQVKRVFDPDPAQVRLMRLLGVNAETLKRSSKQPAAGKGRWLAGSHGKKDAGIQLGLPNPDALIDHGARWLCLGSDGSSSWESPPEGLLHMPTFPPAPALSESTAYALAAWIQGCQDAGLQLLRLKPNVREECLWSSLGVPCFRNPIQPDELLEELQWRQAGQPDPNAIHTPTPSAQVIWQHASGVRPEVSICISSFNYAERIPAALESCHSQSLRAVELLIVDDASTDDSLNQCRQWLEAHGQRFCSAQLLQHQQNSGLAAARNTAFSAASAPWCWVLDADNRIDANACERCLDLAKASSDQTAVVHPLIRICDDNGNTHGFVGNGHPWQREQLQAGNVVDAMALVRRDAWQAVGGYSHIPGGWEDFDFWCKLIEAGWNGVLYPQPLATYTQHGSSMLQSQTNQRQRKLSRLLQHRHPWLQLAFAAENC